MNELVLVRERVRERVVRERVRHALVCGSAMTVMVTVGSSPQQSVCSLLPGKDREEEGRRSVVEEE